jgi:hypothetical protein
MVASRDVERAVSRVRDRESFIQEFLAETLRWNLPEGVKDLGPLSYEWTADELRARGLEARLTEGRAL